MAVNKAAIESDLNTLYDDCHTGDGLSKEEFADRMSTIIKDAILSADLNNAILDPLSASVTDPVSGVLPVNGGTVSGGLI